MSMLAEPRRKKKWSVDPRNSAWSNDESKFGQKMMERMGWSKGKGLGRNMQGTTDNIKVKVKNDSLGLGTNVNHEDNWIAHQDEFNQLLADLNNCHGQNDTTSESSPPDEPAPQGFSLEEKSKTSKKRVHYMKFTKGKDLSNRSEADLNSIFGKRSKSATDQQKENNSRDSLEEENKKEEKNGSPTTTTSEHDVESITKTTISTLSMQEYFAQRMAKLKKRARGGGEAEEVSSSTPEAEETNETPGSSEEVDDAVHANVDCTGEPPKKKKKKKKRNSEVKEEMTETAVAPGIIEGVEDQEGGCSEKKKKKKKRQKAKKEEDAVNGEDCSSTSGLEQNGTEEDLPPAKKKKHKAGNKDTDTIDGPTENLNVESEVVHKKKKKKHREQVDSEVLVVAQEEEVEKKSKKHKKEKKNN